MTKRVPLLHSSDVHKARAKVIYFSVSPMTSEMSLIANFLGDLLLASMKFEMHAGQAEVSICAPVLFASSVLFVAIRAEMSGKA